MVARRAFTGRAARGGAPATDSALRGIHDSSCLAGTNRTSRYPTPLHLRASVPPSAPVSPAPFGPLAPLLGPPADAPAVEEIETLDEFDDLADFDAFDQLGRLAELAPHTAPYDRLDPHDLDPHDLDPHDLDTRDLDPHDLDAHGVDAYEFDPYDFANCPENHEESDVLRRAFMTGGSAALAAASLGGAAPGAAPRASAATRRRNRPASQHAGDSEARAVESAVRQIRVLDDRHGGAGLYRRAGESLRAAYELLDAGTRRQSVSDRLHSGAGELAISVGWLAHDSGRYHDARSHYAEALATSRVAGDAALEAHAFCNTAFLARDAGRPREAVRAAQAGQQAAKQLGSHHLLSLLALREAGGWAGLGDRSGCRQALARAHRLFAQGPGDADPEWMSFFGEAELEGLEAQCWSALGLWERAAEHAQRAVALQDPHFTRNQALFTAELAGDLAAQGQAEAAAAAGSRALDFGPVQSTRISTMLETAAGRLRSFRREPAVAGFLARHAATA